MRTKIIAEIASCHNGDKDLAKVIIDAAARKGADLVKFQDWRASNVPKGDPDKQRYERYEFKEEWYPELIAHCHSRGVEFLTTCFNADRAEFLASLGLKTIKLASISLTNRDLLMAAGANFEHVILSTAMHGIEEIQEAIDLMESNAKHFTVMHCVANYPLPPEDANLLKIQKLSEILTGAQYADIGYSDHSLDLDVAKTAIAMGVSYLEKHFSLSRHLPQSPHQMYKGGPMVTTHEVSIEPHELKILSEWRDKVAIMVGDGNLENNKVEKAIRSRYDQRYGI